MANKLYIKKENTVCLNKNNSSLFFRFFLFVSVATVQLQPTFWPKSFPKTLFDALSPLLLFAGYIVNNLLTLFFFTYLIFRITQSVVRLFCFSYFACFSISSFSYIHSVRFFLFIGKHSFSSSSHVQTEKQTKKSTRRRLSRIQNIKEWS